MKTPLIILILQSIVLVALVILYVSKSRKWAKKEAQADIFEIHPSDMPLDKNILIEIGFKIYDTKDQLYAVHATGISMTWVENWEWVAEIRNSNKIWSDHVYTLYGLFKFAMKHGKEIQATNKN